MFERKVDSLVFRIKSNYFKLNFLSFFYEILWTSYMSPAHIIDMQKTVETAKIDKSTETCK